MTAISSGTRSGGATRPRHAARPAVRRVPTGFPALLRAVGLGLSTGLVLLVAALAVVLVVLPKATGSVPLSVLTQSMEPTLPPGTLVVVRPVAPEDIRVGDVVTYQLVSGRPEVVTHRVVAIGASSDGSRTFVFRGDANAEADADPVIPAQVRGEVWYSVPGLGAVNQVVNGSRTWLLPTLAGLLLAYGVVMITIGTLSAVRRRRRRAERRRAGRDHVARDGQTAETASRAG
ncbi:signal peptidase I [Curtobacterium sp. MCPF17_046]|uniref:signal peptidase I n=1 Tax=Curtobacterium sp. MCPF17_046 TaxID=2175663 RepID=UPI000D8825E4|nr:signal peptidase I [Curtobacterium sp. MCPF17_046]PYY37468.1 signal peptidase I [Curtobacterium sp. MCPF17_046]